MTLRVEGFGTEEEIGAAIAAAAAYLQTEAASRTGSRRDPWVRAARLEARGIMPGARTMTRGWGV